METLTDSSFSLLINPSLQRQISLCIDKLQGLADSLRPHWLRRLWLNRKKKQVVTDEIECGNVQKTAVVL